MTRDDIILLLNGITHHAYKEGLLADYAWYTEEENYRKTIKDNAKFDENSISIGAYKSWMQDMMWYDCCATIRHSIKTVLDYLDNLEKGVA